MRQMTHEEKKIAEALDWAYRQGYTHGEKAAQAFAAMIGGRLEKTDLGVYGDKLEIFID